MRTEMLAVFAGIVLLLQPNLQLVGQRKPVSAGVCSGVPIRRVETSSTILKLAKRLKSGDRGALSDFWRQVAETGTPIFEQVNGEPGQVIVTFVWRGHDGTQTVGLLAPLANAPGLPALPLRRLAGTELWYGSWETRDDLRFTYRFAENLKPGGSSQQTATADPLNPHKMEISFEGGSIPETELSIASLPLAPSERWIAKRPDVPAGKVREQQLNSAILKSKRTIWVYTPPGYNANAPNTYPLLTLFDGYSYQNWIPAATILDNLIRARKIPPTVAVFIDNPPESRTFELAYNLRFADFLAKEVLPSVSKEWRVTRDPSITVVGGYSDGGSDAAFVALLHPELFGNVLSQSGAFWQKDDAQSKWEWLTQQYAAKPKVPVRFWLEAGVLEDKAKEGPSLLAANRHFVEVLRKKGYAVSYEEVGGTHEPVHWRDTLASGITALLHQPK